MNNLIQEHQLMFSQKNAYKPKSLRQLVIWLLVIITPIAMVVIGINTRQKTNEDVKKWTEIQAIPVVRLVDSNEVTFDNKIVLPGRIEAYYKAPIYARVNGYLKKWHKDIGSYVHNGDLLAEIDTPELDHQLDQAKADLASAVQSKSFADVTRQRWENLLVTDSVSKQAADEKVSDFATKTAVVHSLEANVKRLEAMQSFKKVVAPFDGKLTERNTDIGALINAANNGGEAGPPLFVVSDTHLLRVYVNVPEIYADKLNHIVSASLSVPEFSDKQFNIQMKGTAGAVDAKSGSTLSQFSLENKNNLLSPGSYAQVTIKLPVDTNIRRLPVSAIMVRNHGVQVATVDTNNRLIIKSIIVGNDFGSYIEVLSGLTKIDRVIDTPPDLVEDGQIVEINQSSNIKNDKKSKGI